MEEIGKFKGKKVLIEESSQVVSLQIKIDAILDAIGFPGAFVSDESMIADFYLDENDLVEASKKLGTKITDNDCLINIAKRMG